MNGNTRDTTLAAAGGVLSAPGYLLEGFRLLRRPGLRRFVILPVLGNLVIFVAAAFAIFYGLDTALDRWLPEGYAWLRVIVFPLVALVLIAIGMFAFTLLAIVLMSPFLGRLAAAVETLLDGAPPEAPGEGWWRDLRDLRDGVLVELRRLGYAALCLGGVLLIGLLPVVNLIAPPLGFAVSGWLLAGEYAGNPLGNRRWTLAQQLGLLRRHRLRVLAFGSTSFALTLVPLLNLVVIPASVIGMTLLCRDLLAREQALAGQAPGR
jgi:CysZ protein